MSRKTWFITGASRGFGREWTVAALRRGDRVAAAVRDPSAVRDLVEHFGSAVLPLRLDVTDRPAVQAAVADAVERFDHLDVVVNNAGYGQFGMVEEVSEQEARAQLETNFFGALWVTQAALPHLRARRSGHILQISSIGGVTAFPNLGIYHASKWALEGMSQSLAAEVAAFGIKVTIVEPAGYSTEWRGASARRAASMPEYREYRDRVETQRTTGGPGPGDPAAIGPALIAIVEADEAPLRVFLGDGPLDIVTRDYESRLATWRQWQHLSLAAHRVAG